MCVKVILITDQDKDSGDGSVNVTVQDDGQTWDDIKVCQSDSLILCAFMRLL